MIKVFWLIVVFFVIQVYVYISDEMCVDCQVVEEFYVQDKNSGLFELIGSVCCIVYVIGFVDGYLFSDYLVDKVGVKFNVFCLLKDVDFLFCLVCVVFVYFDCQFLKVSFSIVMLVVNVLVKFFFCIDLFELKK